MLTSAGDVYYISKLPWLDPENGRIARFKKVPPSFPKTIVHFRATWNEIYFFESGEPHKPIATNISIETLPNRKLPFTVHTKDRGLILVDPLGASALGLRPGDVINPNNKQRIVVGRSGDLLCVKSFQIDKPIEVIPLPDISTVLFVWTLFSRPGANIKTQRDKNCHLFDLDCSDKGLQKICFFKYGDVIVDKKGVKSTVIGERCDCLWIKTEDENISELAIHYMKENMEKHLSLQDIADQIGYSPSHFSMLFKKKTGHGPVTYFNLLKIQHACFLLDTTDMKINQICYKIGIEDTYYFSRLFSKIMGMSPREYRKSKKG